MITIDRIKAALVDELDNDSSFDTLARMIIDTFREKGYALAIWAPEEIENLCADDFENYLVEKGAWYIEQYSQSEAAE